MSSEEIALKFFISYITIGFLFYVFELIYVWRDGDDITIAVIINRTLIIPVWFIFFPFYLSDVLKSDFFNKVLIKGKKK